MKKILFLLVSVFAIIALTSCGSGNKSGELEELQLKVMNYLIQEEAFRGGWVSDIKPDKEPDPGFNITVIRTVSGETHSLEYIDMPEYEKNINYTAVSYTSIQGILIFCVPKDGTLDKIKKDPKEGLPYLTRNKRLLQNIIKELNL